MKDLVHSNIGKNLNDSKPKRNFLKLLLLNAIAALIKIYLASLLVYHVENITKILWKTKLETINSPTRKFINILNSSVHISPLQKIFFLSHFKT